MFEWILYNLRAVVRRKDNLFFTVVFPIMLVAVLGNMLANLDNPDSNIGTMKVAVYIEDTADASSGGNAGAAHMGTATEAAAIDEFVSALSAHDGIVITRATGAAAAREAVDSGKADAAMIFSIPLSIEVTEGEDIYKNRAAMLMSQSFAREYAAFRTAALSDTAAFMEMARDGIPEFYPDLYADKDLGVSRSMIDYYAVTMIIMIIFMGGGIGGAATIFQSRQDGSLRRITASPRDRTMLFLESVIGTMPQCILQAGIVMVVSTTFLGATYAKTWQGNLMLFGLFLLLGLAVSSSFMLIGLFTRVDPYIPLLAILWALLFLAGTFNKDITIEGFSEYLPMNIVQSAIFDMTVFDRPEQLYLVMGVCGVVLLATCIAGAVLYRRKELMF